jgi:hypothetical protein
VPLLLQGKSLAFVIAQHPHCTAYLEDFLTLRDWPDAARVLKMPTHKAKWRQMMKALLIEYQRCKPGLEQARWEAQMKRTLF